MTLIYKRIPCTIEGCDKFVTARGWCYMHYTRWKRHGDVGTFNPVRGKTVEDGAPYRFIVEIQPSDECIEWPFNLGTAGYPSMRSPGGKTMGAHSFSCSYHHGPRPAKMDACHSCHNRKCVNPNHLRWDTRRANIIEGIEWRKRQ